MPKLESRLSGPPAALSRFSFLNGLTMTPRADGYTPALSPNTPAAATRPEGQALTETILGRLAGSCNDLERRRLQHEVVLLNLALADAIAARYIGRGIDKDDLVQVGRLGLLKAVMGYNPGKGTGFTAYATPTISGEVKRYFRDHAWMVRPPRHLQELHTELSSVEPNLWQRLNRVPSTGELADALGITPGELSDARLARSGYTALSLDAPTHARPDRSRADSCRSLSDDLADEVDPYAQVERAGLLGPALAALTDRQRNIIGLRFVEGQTQQEIGRRLGVSQMQVSRLLVGILKRLRDDLGIDEASATA